MKHSVLRLLVFGCLVGGASVCTWAQQPDLDQLKSRLEQLEQMMQDLRQQINAAEEAQKPPGAPLVAATPTPASGAPAPTPQLSTEYIGEETRLRVVVHDDSDGAPRIDNEELDPELRGFFRLPGTGALIKLSGFVKTDLFVDTNMAGSYYGCSA